MSCIFDPIRWSSKDFSCPVCFLLGWSMRGSATAAVRTLDAAFDESKNKMAESVSRFPNRFLAEMGTHVTIPAWSTNFFSSRFPSSFLLALLTCLWHCFHVNIPSPQPLCRYLPFLCAGIFLRATLSFLGTYAFLEAAFRNYLRYVYSASFFVLHCVFCCCWGFMILLVLLTIIVFSYPVRWPLTYFILPELVVIYFAFGLSLSHRLWPHNVYLSMIRNQDGHWVYQVLMKLGTHDDCVWRQHTLESKQFWSLDWNQVHFELPAQKPSQGWSTH